MSFRLVSLAALCLGLALTGACANTGHGTADLGTSTDTGTGSDAGMDTSAMCTTTANEDTLAACSDGCDNDGNTYIDCNDFGCCDVLTACGPTTACGRPQDGGTVMACADAGTTENTIAQCSDGCDNNGDNFADCNDFDCCGLVECGPTTGCGRRDGGSPVVACTTPVVHENTVETCTDGCSNDGNTYVDCNDSSCCGIEGVTCTGTTYCATHTTPSTTCVGAIEAENTMERCTDSCSNDNDPFVDCDDYDCCDVAGVTCAPTTMCGRSDGGTAVDAG